MNLQSLDLNLLRVFDAIYIERSISRAAIRLNLSQPAVSNALSRLRERIGDPLFERTAEGMAPTPRAKTIAEPIQRALDLLREGLSQRSGFDFSESKRTFELAVEDYGENVILPRFLKWLHEVAPGIRIVIRPQPGIQAKDALRRGSVDLALGFFVPGTEDFHHHCVMTDTLLTLARQDHPAILERLTLETFLSVKHVALIPRTKSMPMIDLALAKRDLQRDIVVQVPHFQSMPVIVRNTDLLGTLPKRMAVLYADHFGLQPYQPPVRTPDFPVYLIWHQSADDDIAHRWLRDALIDLCQRL
ncbi:LysR family transcriptional regulator [Pusillimonas sp. MFBS29]|uniref:LysR family transcriptional regulator n=1 Tax=Pusillimonas sp. MFBS29 TaxID=2886690 RepID=UPI001D1302EF|nr:LysR family transcriptional regulator [Pusillimonas sp. MFBS29]MCC2596170.1 LysR family transcriptional regulator [Pusillimonas sp. MFBS29]